MNHPPTDPGPASTSGLPGRRLFRLLLAAGAALVLLDLGFRLFHHDKHGYFLWEEWPGFYAAFGFAACALAMLAARFLLRPLAWRREDYFESPGKEDDDHA